MLRAALVIAIAVVLPLAHAQTAKKAPTIGFLGNSTAALEAATVGGFQQGLRDQGLADASIVFQWAGGQNERLPELAGELVKRNVNLIVTSGTPATLAVKRATSTIPIIMVGVGDPVGAGLVSSLAKPGGNITGIATLARELEGKRLELLRQLVPKMKRVAVLMNPKNPFTPLALAGMQPPAKTLDIQLLPAEASTAAELETALGAVKAKQADAVIMIADRFLLANRGQIVEAINRQRLPSIFPFPEFVDGGALISYSPNYVDMYRRAGAYAAKVAAGARPADLPIDLPTKFELVLNARTAQSLGIRIPDLVRMRADRVIE